MLNNQSLYYHWLMLCPWLCSGHDKTTARYCPAALRALPPHARHLLSSVWRWLTRTAVIDFFPRLPLDVVCSTPNADVVTSRYSLFVWLPICSSHVLQLLLLLLYFASVFTLIFTRVNMLPPYFTTPMLCSSFVSSPDSSYSLGNTPFLKYHRNTSVGNFLLVLFLLGHFLQGHFWHQDIILKTISGTFFLLLVCWASYKLFPWWTFGHGHFAVHFFLEDFLVWSHFPVLLSSIPC